MAKFIVGVIVGLFLGTSVSAYSGSVSRSNTLLSWQIPATAKLRAEMCKAASLLPLDNS
jgi:hypothetical protein